MDKLTEQQKKRMTEAGQAAMNMSHGIKNIVQSIRSGQEVMDEALQRRDMEVAKRTWNILKQNLDRIQKLSLDMLKFSKDEALNVQPCHFNRLVESVVQTVRPQADQRQIEMIVHADEQIEPVPLDTEKMQDVIMNLLINAIEAVEPKTGQVVVHTESDCDGQHVILRISDNGPGIADTNIIFEPFHSTKDNVGAGLGLTIARRVIQKHRGALEAKSLPGKGAMFTVRIPARTS